MSPSNMVRIVFLCVFAVAVSMSGDVLALGGKSKSRTVLHKVKSEQINVGDEEGHVMEVYEKRGIQFNMLDTSGESRTVREVAMNDLNLRAGDGVTHGVTEIADKEGHKIYSKWEGTKRAGDAWKGTWVLIKGTGKYEGIKGKGTWMTTELSPTDSYDDSEGEWELPGR
jgi:hypothetical protein